MPTTTIIVLTAITAAFVVFAVVLAWGDRQTRNLPGKIASNPPKEPSLSATRRDAAASTREHSLTS